MKTVVNHDVLAVLPTGYRKSLIYQSFVVAKELLNSSKACVLVICPLTSIIQDQIVQGKALRITCVSLHDLEEVKQNTFLSTRATNSVRFSFALFQCQPYIFTLLCGDNTERAFFL